MDSISLTSCTRIHNISSVPRDVFDGHVSLNWTEPACGHCEVQGKGCALDVTSAGNRTKCVYRDNKQPGNIYIPTIYIIGFLFKLTFESVFSEPDR